MGRLEKFLSELRPNSRRRYQTVLNDFKKFCGTLENITEQDVFSYWDHLKARHLGSATLRNQMKCLRSMFEYLKKRGHIQINPFEQAAIRMPREFSDPRRKTEAVEFEKVLELCNMPHHCTLDGIRDRAFLAMLFGGGLRLSEAQNLRMSDVRAYVARDGGTYIYLVLREPKGGFNEEQPLPHWAAERVLRLVEQRHAENAGLEDFLMVGYRASGVPKEKSLHLRTLSRLFHRYRKLAGLPGTITPHSGRVTAITRLYDRGVGIKEIQKFARHSFMSTTERYIRLEDSFEKSGLEKLRY